MPLVTTPETEIGKSAPDFELVGTDQRVYRRQDFFKPQTPTVVMFICNHCPYVKAIEQRLIQLGHELRKLGVPVVAISSNDAKKYPEDSFEKMQGKNYPFPYLYDETQDIARSYGAVCTPDFFVYNNQGLLAYRGRLDDSWKDPNQVTRQELLQAVLELKAGALKVSGPHHPSMGCSLKWKEHD